VSWGQRSILKGLILGKRGVITVGKIIYGLVFLVEFLELHAGVYLYYVGGGGGGVFGSAQFGSPGEGMSAFQFSGSLPEWY
jgi:hypothetical protein